MRALVVEKNLLRMLAVKALRPLWPGVIWTPLSAARVIDLAEPSLPGEAWLRVRNRQCGICASDLSLLNVEVNPGVAPAALPGNQTFYLGHEVVGEVVEAGPAVKRFRPGDRVVMESRFAGANCHTLEIHPPCAHCAQGETRLCENASLGGGAVGVGGGWGDGYTAHQDEEWPVPEDLNDDQAALIEPLSVSLHGVLRRPPQDGEHVLIIGAGIIGLMAVQVVRALCPGAHLSVLARYDHQAQAARKLGADEVVRSGELYRTVASITGAKFYRAPMNRGMLLGGYEVIYDCVGSRESVLNALRWARAAGTVVLIGITFAALRVDLSPVWYQEVDLIGSHTFGVEAWEGRRVHTFDLAIEMMQSGAIQHEGLITHRFGFEDYRKAIWTAAHKRSGAIKVMFVYGAG